MEDSITFEIFQIIDWQNIASSLAHTNHKKKDFYFILDVEMYILKL